MKLVRPISILLAVLGAAWLARAAATPTVTFEVSPPNPVAGQSVALRDTSPEPAASWLWDFGDGASASTAAPSHGWAEPGTYTVRLDSQGSNAELTVTVSPDTTLRLLAAHPFEISIEAVDPSNGNPSPARAIAISDRFGWFSFPGLTHDPGNPEVTVKVLEAPAYGHYWIFWSAMTSLEYTMTVRDVGTGQVQVYTKDGPSACGGWDTESFAIAPTPTPSAGGATATPSGPTPTDPPGTTRTPTRTRTVTGTPTSTPTVTPTPTPSGPTQITLRAQSWQWDWCPSADQGIPGLGCTMRTCPYEIPSDQSVHGVITLHEGCSYQLTLYNGDQNPDLAPFHTLNARPDIGLPQKDLYLGQTYPPITITIPAGTADQVFSCLNTSCGNSTQHEGMTGLIQIAP